MGTALGSVVLIDAKLTILESPSLVGPGKTLQAAHVSRNGKVPFGRRLVYAKEGSQNTNLDIGTMIFLLIGYGCTPQSPSVSISALAICGKFGLAQLDKVN